ncbi:MAG TPA: FAD-dependent oxidoreductase [Pyrinomonadaceae bacterium]|nr:FAD-dependent oxidoreductase [Pyrinomonadaceae bacterium]
MGTAGVDLDVLVVGAGPAGCAAAIHCAQRGLSVALLEREEFPRDRPGETLHPGVEPLLRQLGLGGALQSADFPRHPGIWVRWDSEPRFEPFGADADGPWMGFQAWRATFDALLLDRARDAGVIVRQPCRADSPALDGARVTGVRASCGELPARFVIDAAGSGHWLARKLSLGIRRRSPRLLVRFGYVRGECSARDEAPALVADEAGWTWTARVRPRLYGWARLSWRDARQSDAGPPEELRGLIPHGPVRAADVTWRMVSEPAGPGYFLAGDAAALLDPASSHGVLKGIMSGMMAAHLCAAVIVDGASEQQASREYRRWLADWFEADAARLRELYARLPQCDWPSRPV